MRRPTLQQVFVFSILGLAVLLGALFVKIDRSTRAALMESSSRIRAEKTKGIGARVQGDLDLATRSRRHVEGLFQHSAVRIEDLRAVEAVLYAEVGGEPALSEMTVTHALPLDEQGDDLELAPGDRWQVSVFRTEDDRIVTRHDYLEKGRFVRDTRQRPVAGDFTSAPPVRQSSGEVPDPTAHPTFRVAARKENRQEVQVSDLHWSQLDDDLPAERRRVVVTSQKALEDPKGRFLGVLRVGFLAGRLDLDLLAPQPTPDDPHRVFFCDAQGRLITRIGPRDRVTELGDDLRVVPVDPPPEVEAALRAPALRAVGPSQPAGSAEVVAGQTRYLASYAYLADSQGWIVGIVGPESYYLGGLGTMRRDLLVATVGIIAVCLLLGVLTLGWVRRGLEVVVKSTERMRDFDFSPSEVRLPLRDLQDVGERLELAKTAMRAMGRYVPVDLVRLLYQTGREPVLGGELVEVSLLFTDIEGSTTLAERLEPNELARALGRYFAAMTAAVHAHQGVIDKYIGDAIMALWNAPRPCPEHTRRACEAALACVRAGETLFASGDWAGLPPLVTRYGIHRDRVMVGHFGAPDRMSYTAMGDGVNLAARLEGLNKQYGTTILMSEDARRDVGPHFEARLLDRVAVKGKTRGIEVYELLGAAGSAVPDLVRAYERALHAYWGRDFAGAAAILESQPDDPPSRKLLERCRRFLAEPPPADWNGTWVATSK